MRYLYTICFALLLLGCSVSDEESYQGNKPSVDKVQIMIGQTVGINARTSIDNGGRAVWSIGDKFALWAKASNGAFAVEGEPFELLHYDNVLKSAIFTAWISPLVEDTYSYYAVYPLPISKGATTAMFHLPSVQQVSHFNGDYDIMVACPVTNAAPLTENGINNLDFEFAHKMHTLRFKIAEGANLLGEPVKRIEFTFPTEVTGDVEVDFTNPDMPVQLTHGSRNLTVEIPEGFDVGDETYGVIFPTDISGQITYRAYSTSFQSQQHSVNVSKVAAPSHLTPMNLVIPENNTTAIYITIGENYLGEEPSHLWIIDHNGNTVGSFERNTDDVYILQYFDYFNTSTISGKQFKVRFESENAIVEQPFTMPTINLYKKNVVATPIRIPYLFEEDFGNLTSFHSDDEYSGGDIKGDMSITTFLSGWQGGRVGGEGGKAIRLAARRQTSWGYPARVDSPAFSNLKAGASVRVRVTYDYGMNRQEGGIGTANIGQTCYCGYTENYTPSNSADSNGTYVKDFYIKETNASYDNIPHTDQFEIDAAKSVTRLSWRTVCENKAGANNSTCWLYLDNVKVQIVR